MTNPIHTLGAVLATLLTLSACASQEPGCPLAADAKPR